MFQLLQKLDKMIFVVNLLTATSALAQPAVSSFSPVSGHVGTSVIITGTNFNVVAANNIVFFGAVKGIVTSGNATSLTVTVPAGATYKPISVLNNATGLTGYSSKPFIITFANTAGIPANLYNLKATFPVLTSPRPAAIIDVDGDGKPDLVVLDRNADKISILRNTSTSGTIDASSFAAKVDFTSGSFGYYLALCDVDGDGKPDIVVATNQFISVLRNTSVSGVINAASFAAKVDFASGFTGPNFMSIADLDGDGKPELINSNDNGKVSVWRNVSSPGVIDISSFAAKVDFTVGGTPVSVTVGDVDGDGKPDMVFPDATLGANKISILRNITIANSISFAAKVDFATGSTPRSVAIGDVDGDGKPDLVVANSEPASTTVSVLRNTTTSGIIDASSFAAKVDFTTGLSPFDVTLADLDGDGKLDLAVANQFSNSISLLRNTATPGSITASSFAGKVDFGTGTNTHPLSIEIGDLDGDGLPEIVTANSSTSSVSVLQINLSALPVTITNVKAYSKNNGVQVEWLSQQESNIDRYEVERSENGQDFLKVGTVMAKGNSGITLQYNFFDPNPLNDVSFYRIKVIEHDHGTYSQILKVTTINSSVNTLIIYPNPIQDNAISLKINLPQGSYHILLTNKQGQQILSKVIAHAKGTSTESLKLPNALAAGVYQLRLAGENIIITRQLISK